MKRHGETGGASLLVVLGVAGLLVLGAVSLYVYASGVRQTALDWETDLNKAVRVEVSERATYETSIMEQLDLSNLKADRMKDIISSAIAGRYGDNPGQGKALFQAVAEAYPGTEGLNIYDKVLTSIAAGREAIRNKQNLRIEMAQAFNNWRKQGFVRSRILNGVYPSTDLTFKVGDKTYVAVEALEKMSEPISTANVNDSFEKGVEKPIKMR